MTGVQTCALPIYKDVADYQRAMEKGDLRRMLELGANIVSLIPAYRAISTTLKVIGRTGQAYTVSTSTMRAASDHLKQSYKKAGVDFTNPTATAEFARKHPEIYHEASRGMVTSVLSQYMGAQLATGIAQRATGKYGPEVEKALELVIEQGTEDLL